MRSLYRPYHTLLHAHFEVASTHVQRPDNYLNVKQTEAPNGAVDLLPLPALTSPDKFIGTKKPTPKKTITPPPKNPPSLLNRNLFYCIPRHTLKRSPNPTLT